MASPLACAIGGAAAVAAAAAACGACRLRRRHWSRRRAGPTRVFYVMRHGRKDDDNVPDRDNFKIQLTEEGREGMAAVQRCLRARGARFDAVLCSPFLRCRQTAAIVSPEVAPELEPGLSEVLSDAHGLRDGSGGSGGIALLAGRVRDLMRTHGRGEPLVAAGELERDEDVGALMQCMRRCAVLVERLERKYKAGHVLLVTHGGTAFGIIQALTRTLERWCPSTRPSAQRWAA
ncbi:unnamed protein product [Prorocentrum cordatum]|uniref:Uncharacterized protein n=1 Tax=Prorocentrum cordatum TaxID=2364126 RepID=A0ABN9X5N0_9DINO|nr:unnamed protein product [Polarella glacialis]